MRSGYRLMWVMTMFDLPVGTREERKAATTFRHFLLDEGFEMCQYSVYLRFAGTFEKAEAITRKVGKAVPRIGLVQVLYFTDKQYERIVSFDGHSRMEPLTNPQQLVLF